AWIALTSLSLCSGLAWAKTSISRTHSCNAASFIASISVPAIDVLPSPMPSIFAIAAVVILWSPGHCHVGEFYLTVARRACGRQTGNSMTCRVREWRWTPTESAILGRRDNALPDEEAA